MHTAKKISNPAMSKSKLLCRFLGFILQVQFFLNLSSLHKRQRGAQTIAADWRREQQQWLMPDTMSEHRVPTQPRICSADMPLKLIIMKLQASLPGSESSLSQSKKLRTVMSNSRKMTQMAATPMTMLLSTMLMMCIERQLVRPASRANTPGPTYRKAYHHAIGNLIVLFSWYPGCVSSLKNFSTLTAMANVETQAMMRNKPRRISAMALPRSGPGVQATSPMVGDEAVGHFDTRKKKAKI